MTQEQYQRILNSEEDEDFVERKYRPVIGQQSMWSSWYDSGDGLEGRRQFGRTNLCYRIGEKEFTHTEFADIDD